MRNKVVSAVAARHGLPVSVVANGYIRVPQDPLIERIAAGSGMDAADDWIAERAGKGDIVITLDMVGAPRTAQQFLAVVKSGHYSGATFYRIEPGFLIQAGDYDSAGRLRKAQRPNVPLETATNKHARGLRIYYEIAFEDFRKQLGDMFLYDCDPQAARVRVVPIRM